MQTLGKHLLCELSGCNADILGREAAVRHAIEAAAASAEIGSAKAAVEKSEGGSLSAVVQAGGAHIALHTFPQARYAAVDVYMQGEAVRPDRAVQILAATLEAQQIQIRDISRGIPDAALNIYANKDTSGCSATGGVSTPDAVDSGDAARASRRSWYVEDADPHERHLYEVAEWLYSGKSPFQSIGIIKNRSYGRILLLDGAVQSSERDEYVYHEALIHPAMIAHPNPQNVLILGGGEGASLREVLRHRSVKQAVMVDIDGEVVERCRELLPEWSAGAYYDQRARLVIADGKKWIEESGEKFDVIFMDLTDQIDLGPSFALYTKDFYKTVSSRLNPGGIFLVQAGELSICECFSHATIRKTLATSFASVRTYLQHIPTFFAQWSWVAASNDPVALELTGEEIDRRIAARVEGELKFYDSRAHLRMFTLTKDLAALLKNSGTVALNPEQFEREYNQSQQVFSV